jgi:hypothetical protein
MCKEAMNISFHLEEEAVLLNWIVATGCVKGAIKSANVVITILALSMVPFVRP